jgi:hypothetical protein
VVQYMDHLQETTDCRPFLPRRETELAQAEFELDIGPSGDSGATKGCKTSCWRFTRISEIIAFLNGLSAIDDTGELHEIFDEPHIFKKGRWRPVKR